MISVRKALLTLSTMAAIAPAQAGELIEPRRISRPEQLRVDEGALLLSIRHQTPIAQTMHVRFTSATDPTRVIKFERKVGLGGRTRMLERQVEIYAVPAGKWKLASHLAGCDGKLEPGRECVLTIGSNTFPLPSGTYPDGWIDIDVPAGGFTDADELSLEFPAGTAFGEAAAPGSVVERTRALRFKARALPMPDKSIGSAFAKLTPGLLTASAEARSAIRCERPAKELKLYYNPFAC